MKEGSEVPRRGQIAKRDVLPDPLYGSKLVTRLINSVMYDGKRIQVIYICIGADGNLSLEYRRYHCVKYI